MIGREETTKNKVLILLAPEFEESQTVYCMEKLRQASLSVCLVSMSSGLVKGKHGLFIRPDYTLDQLLQEQPIRLILIPGGQTCSASIMSDPRVHRLVNATLNENNYVAALHGAEPILHQVGLVQNGLNGNYVGQGTKQVNEFAEHLIALVAEPSSIPEAV